MANIVVTEDNTTVYVNDGDVVKVNIAGGGTVTIKAAPGSSVKFVKVHYLGDDHSDTVIFDLSTFSEPDLRIDIHHYDPTDVIKLLGAFNKAVDPDNLDELHFDYVGANGQPFNGYVHAQDGQESDWTNPIDPVIICFAEGTVIDTDLGPRPVESLRPGDLVATQDNGLQPVRWIDRRQIDSLGMARYPDLRPILIRQGALGGGLPHVDLRVSAQHRIQLSDWRAELLFGEPRVLVAAKHLVDGHGIVVDRDADSVRYYHLLFDRHEVVFANGAPAESLHPGDMALQGIEGEAMAELARLFPDLADDSPKRRTAQMVLKSFEARAACAYAA